MNKEEILKNISVSLLPSGYSGRNIMGVSEDFYDPDYLIGKCFSEEELKSFSEETLKSLVKLAEFSTEVFY